ncbi:hypothetical protein TNCT_282221 [Trichonephila clavata]|uniref:Uncharacterized protein n=1 Tax=Trichonephila clavata TaxID=2740835 RepID=A0A8X6H8W0_TRICU|nr:hypothetical protein TNCT_282221 [Trichonephila clavata]
MDNSKPGIGQNKLVDPNVFHEFEGRHKLLPLFGNCVCGSGNTSSQLSFCCHNRYRRIFALISTGPKEPRGS